MRPAKRCAQACRASRASITQPPEPAARPYAGIVFWTMNDLVATQPNPWPSSGPGGTFLPSFTPSLLVNCVAGRNSATIGGPQFTTGSPAQLTSDNNAVLDLVDDFTIGLTFRVTTAQAGDSFVAERTTFKWRFTVVGILRLLRFEAYVFDTAMGQVLFSTLSISLPANYVNTWFTVFAWYNKNDRKVSLWRDGAVVSATAGAIGGTHTSATGIRVGNNASNPFFGMICDLAYWRRILTEGERLLLSRTLIDDAESIVYAAKEGIQGPVGNADWPAYALPTTPGQPSVEAQTGVNVVAWTSIDPNATNFGVYRAVDGGAETYLDAAPRNAVYLDYRVSAASQYAYRVKAVNSLGESAYSAVGYGVPVAPNAVSVVANVPDADLHFTHPALSGGGWVDNYEVDYQINGGGWISAGAPSASPFNFVPAGINSGDTLECRIRSVKDGLVTSYSNASTTW